MTLDNIRRIVESDFETKDIVVSDVDLYVVYRYITLRDSHYEKDGYKPVLVTNPYIEIKMEPTVAKLKKIENEKIQSRMHFFDTTTYVQNADLSLFNQTTDERKKAFKEAIHFLTLYHQKKEVNGLYLYGKYGTGKSYLLSAIAIELIKKNVGVLFVYMPDLVRTIKQGIVENNLEQRINQLKQIDVLMLDDFGGEHMTSWFRDEVLMPVIQYRLSTKLPVFISSNYTLENLTNFLAAASDKDDKFKAVRLIQRIRNMTTYLPLHEKQYQNIDK